MKIELTVHDYKSSRVNESRRKRTRAREEGEFRVRERERATPAAGSQLPVRLWGHTQAAKGTECTGGAEQR